MRAAVVTSISGPNQRSLRDPDVILSSHEYHAFVDDAATSSYVGGVWQIHSSINFSNNEHYSARRNAKIFKILPELFLPGYDMYTYVDPSHEVVRSSSELAFAVAGHSFGVFGHQYRNCVYEEAQHIFEGKWSLKEHMPLMSEQLDFYKSVGMPTNTGLYELPCFVKIASSHTLRLSLAWWEQICKYSSRDQLSLPYIFWQFGETPKVLDGLAFNKAGTKESNEYIRYID